MGRHSPRKVYPLLAAWTFLAIAAVAAVATVLQLGAIRGHVEQDAAESVSSALVPLLDREADDLSFEALDSFEDAARDLRNDRVRAIRLWSEEGSLLATTEADQTVALDVDAIEDAAGGGVTAARTETPGGDVLASFSGLPSGAVVEIQQDYGPIAASVARDRQFSVLVLVGGAAVLLLLVELIAWAATRGLRIEYDRLRYLYRSGQGIRSTLDLPAVLERLARDAAQYVHAQFGLVTLLDEKSNDLILEASVDRRQNTTAQHHRKADEWFIRRCAATGETVQAHLDRPQPPNVLGYEFEYDKPVSVVCVPIPSREEVIGVLTVIRDAADGTIKASQVQMLEEIAAQASMAVEQASLFAKVRSYANEVELSYDSTLKVLMAALDTKDSVTQGHSERVSRLTVSLAREMGVAKERLVDIERGALLHDVGKIGVPDHVLRKPASLDEAEWESMQKHPLLAGLMVSKVNFLEGALPILLYHHERYDGSGYPFGLKADAIPLDARIFAVVDSFDAMTSDRPYRQAMSPDAALREIQQNAGIQFDPKVVEAFTRVMARMQPIKHEHAA